MAIDYESYFEISKVYCSDYRKTYYQSVDIDSSILNAMQTFRGDADRSNELRNLLKYLEKWKNYAESTTASRLQSEHTNWITQEGFKVLGSGNTTGANIAGDLVTFMTRDSETVLTNIIGQSVDYSRDGDGTISLIQNQMTRNDIISLTCTTAQTGVIDAVFNINTQLEGLISGVNITADGSTDYTDSVLGKYLGFESFIVDEGTAGNYWALGDQIVITTTSDERSYLLSAYRDWYSVELPSSASPTISNTLVGTGSSFPLSPTDGDEFIIDGIKYYYSETLTEWVESCN